MAINIPVYKLFGEQQPWPTPDMLHCESLAVRSRLHNWQISPHRHNGLFQILFLGGGTAHVTIDDTSHEMGAGNIMLVPQMCIHGFRFEQDVAGYVVTLAYPLIRKLAQDASDSLLALNSPRILMLPDDAEGTYIKAAFQALDAEYRGNATYRSLQTEAILGLILIGLARHAMQPTQEEPHHPGRRSEHFRNFCQLVDEHYMEHMPLSWYARRLGITAPHLNALCRQVAGQSALGLIHERVILEAKRNLVYSSMPVNLVSYAIGFSDPAYFTRFFKRIVGVSPKEFRLKAGTM